MRLSSLPRSIAQLAACALVAGVLASGGTANAAKKDDTLRFAYDQAPESVDPYFNNVRIGVIIGANVWDTLIYPRPGHQRVQGTAGQELEAGRRQDHRVRTARRHQVP